MDGLGNLVEERAPIFDEAYVIPKEIHPAVHGHLKDILLATVRQTQMVDQCNVKIMMTATQRVAEALRRMKVIL